MQKQGNPLMLRRMPSSMSFNSCQIKLYTPRFTVIAFPFDVERRKEFEKRRYDKGEIAYESIFCVVRQRVDSNICSWLLLGQHFACTRNNFEYWINFRLLAVHARSSWLAAPKEILACFRKCALAHFTIVTIRKALEEMELTIRLITISFTLQQDFRQSLDAYLGRFIFVFISSYISSNYAVL